MTKEILDSLIEVDPQLNTVKLLSQMSREEYKHVDNVLKYEIRIECQK